MAESFFVAIRSLLRRRWYENLLGGEYNESTTKSFMQMGVDVAASIVSAYHGFGPGGLNSARQKF